MSDDGKRESVENLISRFKKSFRVDSRYGVLEFEPGTKYLRVLTDSISNASRISGLYRKTNSEARIKVVLLPDDSVGGFSKGVCHVGVAPVRRHNDSTSEQVTQVLYGESFDTLQIVDTWVRARLHADGYLGWISANQVTLLNGIQFDSYKSMPKVHVAAHTVPLLSKPLATSAVVREAVFGCRLSTLGELRNFWEIAVPDGSIGYVEKSKIISSPAKSGVPPST
ncbi:MAG: hypothetical protein M1339_00110, partial [Bacteroidetes bacterium]|nr:hypothetical protein [Bacteroidota bacterium]